LKFAIRAVLPRFLHGISVAKEMVGAVK